MTARATKTQLAFGLVTCPVALYRTSVEEKPPTFQKAGPRGGKLLAPNTGTPSATSSIQRHMDEEQRVDPLGAEVVGHTVPIPDGLVVAIEDGTGEKLHADDIRRGLRRDDGSFLDLTDGLQQIEDATKLEEMRVADFIRTEEVTRERILGSYYVAPDGAEALKVITLLADAMRAKKRVAVVKFTKRSKQSLGVLVPRGAGLTLVELAWAADMREEPAVTILDRLGIYSSTELDLAMQLVEAMSSTRADALDTQTDDARRLRAELIENGGTVLLPDRPVVEEGAEVIELMRAGLQDRDALRRSAA